jgi:DNA-binding NarL/FixJ family response regulator
LSPLQTPSTRVGTDRGLNRVRHGRVDGSWTSIDGLPADAVSALMVDPQQVAARLTEYFPRMALTLRETEVLELVARGLGNAEIAEQLGTASGTIKIHVQNILEKLAAEDRTHAVAIAIRRGILHVP